MMNLFYRGYVIHEDIRSICYTIFSAKPQRTELASRSTALEAMLWVDRELARYETARWGRLDTDRRNKVNLPNPAQPVLL
jgi:hypothetical protein